MRRIGTNMLRLDLKLVIISMLLVLHGTSALKNSSHSTGVLTKEIIPPSGPQVVWHKYPAIYDPPQEPSHNVEVWSPSRWVDTEQGCNISVHEGVLYYSGHDDVVRVETIAGAFSIPVRALQATKFFGPIQVITGECRSILLGLDICKSDSGHYSDTSDVCTAKSDVLWHTMFWVSAMITVVTLIVNRYLWVRFHHRRSGCHLVATSGGWFKYFVIFREDRMSARFNKAVVEEEIPSVMVDPQTETKKKTIKVEFNLKTLLLTMLLFKSFGSETLTVNCLRFSTVRMTEGGLHEVHDNTIRAVEAHHYSALTLQYHTATWVVKEDGDWYCNMHKCNNVINCLETDPKGDRLNHTIIKQANGTGRITSSFCRMNAKGCFTGLGCYKWFLHYDIDFSTVADVFSIGSPTEIIKATSAGPGGIEISGMRLKNTPQMHSSSVVRDSKRKWWFCPYPSSKASPAPGALGDLQFNEQLFYTLSQDVSSCISTEDDGVVCNHKSSFLHELSIACVELPSFIGGYSVSVGSSGLNMKQDNNLELTIASEGSIIQRKGTPDCGKIVASLWGERFSGVPIWLILTTSGIDPESTMDYTLPCSGETFTVSCDKKPARFEVSQVNSCANYKDGVTNNLADKTEMDFMKSETKNFLGSGTGGHWWSAIFGAIASWSFFHVMNGMNLVLILAGLILWLKK